MSKVVNKKSKMYSTRHVMLLRFIIILQGSLLFFNILLQFMFNFWTVRGGLTLREGIQVMEESYRTQRLSAVDLVEVNPRLGSPAEVKITLEAAKHIIRAACGHSRRGHSPENVHDLPQQTFHSVPTSQNKSK
jgi:hypothetical protein